MKSKSFIYAGLGVAAVVLVLVGAKVFAKKTPPIKPAAVQTSRVTGTTREDSVPAASTIADQHLDSPHSDHSIAVSDAPTTTEPSATPETEKEGQVLESPSLAIVALKQTIESLTIEIANLKAASSEKDREIISAREWSKTRNELIQQLRSEIKALQDKLESVNSSISARTEALDGVKARTFLLNP